jgi:hypothetical protein
MPGDQGISETDAAENRRLRMQRIDLTGYESAFPVREADETHARVENVAHADQELFHILLHKGCNIPVVYLDDPIGIAEQLFAEHKVCLEDLEALGELMGDGEYALGGLVRGVAESSENLAKHVDQGRLEGAMESWDTEAERLIEEARATEERLVVWLDPEDGAQTRLSAALGDWLDAHNTPESQAVGIARFTRWLQGLGFKPGEALLERLKDGRITCLQPLHDLRDDPETHQALGACLRDMEAGRFGNSFDDGEAARTTGLSKPKGYGEGVLSELSEKLVLAEVKDEERGMANLALWFTALLGTKITAGEATLAQIYDQKLAEVARSAAARSGYMYLPQLYPGQRAELERIRVGQLQIGGRPLPAAANAAAWKEHPLVTQGLSGVLAVLHLVNVGVSVAGFSRARSSDDGLGRAAATMFTATAWALAYTFGQLEPRARATKSLAEHTRDGTRSHHQNLVRRLNEAKASPNERRKYLARNATIQARRSADLADRAFMRATWTHDAVRLGLRAFTILGAALGTGISAWDTVQRVRTGNTPAATGAAMTTAGSAMIGGVAVYGAWTGSLALSGPVGWILGAGIGLLLAGTWVMSRFDYGPLEETLRHGHFGVQPYHRGGPFTEPELEGRLAFGPQVHDLRPQMARVYRLLFTFEPSVEVLREYEPTMSRVGAPSGGTGRRVIRVEIAFSQFRPLESVLDFSVVLQPYGGAADPGRVLSKEEFVVSERSEGGRLTSVTFLARLDGPYRRWRRFIATARCRLDIFGDGKWCVPEDGERKEAKDDPRGMVRSRQPGWINAREYDRIEYAHQRRQEAR